MFSSTGVWTASPERIGLWSGTLTPLRGPAVSPRLMQGFLSPPTPSPRSAAVPICGAVVCCRSSSVNTNWKRYLSSEASFQEGTLEVFHAFRTFRKSLE